MRSLFKLSLAALVATFFAAGLALAQDDKPELKITLGVRGAFGQLTQSTAVNQDTDPKSEKDKSTTSEAGWKNEGQTDLTFLYTTSKVTAKAFYRFRESDGNEAGQAAAASAPTSLRSDIYWKATDMVSLGFITAARAASLERPWLMAPTAAQSPVEPAWRRVARSGPSASSPM